MATQLIQPERIAPLNDRKSRDGDYMLYWMQQSQRAQCNHALEYAVRQANEHQQRLLVVFVIPDKDDERTLRQATFMLEGLQQTQNDITSRGIKMVVRIGDPVKVAAELAKNASMVVCDRGYLRSQTTTCREVADQADCRVVCVESDMVIPVETVSDQLEYAARTIRPKIHEHLDEFLVDLSTTAIGKDSTTLSVAGENLSDLDSIVDQIQGRPKRCRRDRTISRWSLAGFRKIEDVSQRQTQVLRRRSEPTGPRNAFSYEHVPSLRSDLALGNRFEDQGLIRRGSIGSRRLFRGVDRPA